MMSDVEFRIIANKVYLFICLFLFIITDINECLVEDLCRNGRCVNAQGSFNCDCKQGYALDDSERDCVGECQLRRDSL